MILVFISLFVLSINASADMALVPAGRYVPFILKAGKNSEYLRAPIKVDGFQLDRTVVSNEDFLSFVKKHSQWRKSQVPRIFADSHYLEGWKSDLQLRAPKDRSRPVTQVSWFAAKAYCESMGKTLPTTDQWEYALADQGRNKEEINRAILAWYGQPNSVKLASVDAGSSNGFGLKNMVGLVWEWTLDFNSATGGDEADNSDKNGGFYCGGASLGKLDSSDYATFMRYSFRASLKASYTTSNLGFRCAKKEGAGT